MSVGLLLDGGGEVGGGRRDLVDLHRRGDIDLKKSILRELFPGSTFEGSLDWCWPHFQIPLDYYRSKVISAGSACVFGHHAY
jgi:hypothetical protein